MDLCSLAFGGRKVLNVIDGKMMRMWIISFASSFLSFSFVFLIFFLLLARGARKEDYFLLDLRMVLGFSGEEVEEEF